MTDRVYWIVFAFTVITLFVLLRCVEYGTRRAIMGITRGQHRVSAFCEPIITDYSVRLRDPVLTRQGYYIGDLECLPTGPFKSVVIKDLIVSTFLTECPSFETLETINWLCDWLEVKCRSVQNLAGYNQVLDEQIRTATPGGSMAVFYRDRMDPRQYLGPPQPNVWISRDITEIDPFDDSWYIAVNSDTDYIVFENARSISYRISQRLPQRPLGEVLNATAFIGRFCETNSTVGIELRADKTRYRIFKHVTNITTNVDEPRNCCMCLEPITRTSLGVSTLSCGHFDHDDCINEWFDHNYSCPECREDDISIVQ